MNEEKRPKFVMKKWTDRRLKIGKSLSRLADFWWSPRDGTRTPKIIVLRDYVVLRIAV